MEIKKNKFKLKSKFKPAGDQAAAIKGLISGIDKGKNMQTLLGVTGSGKTFTMANVIAKVGKPTLVLAHNKTLAAQLYEEMREFFPENRVEYFISYYDYYQPESYLPALSAPGFHKQKHQQNSQNQRSKSEYLSTVLHIKGQISFFVLPESVFLSLLRAEAGAVCL